MEPTGREPGRAGTQGRATLESDPGLKPIETPRWVRRRVRGPSSPEGRAARLIAVLDERIARQVDAIIHHAKFQALEARWRGLRRLVDDLPVAPDRHLAKVIVLDLSWSDLLRDLREDWERSWLFEKVYAQRFGVAGGHPIGLLVADFAIGMRPRDLHVLRSLAQIGAAAFAPFLAAAHASLLGLGEDMGELGGVFDLKALARQVASPLWVSLRAHPDARFVALTVPRTLGRRPHRRGYSATTRRACVRCGRTGPSGAKNRAKACETCGTEGRIESERFGFSYREASSARSDFVWMNGAFAVARVALRCFVETGWHVDLFGMSYGREGNPSGGSRPGRGLLTDVPSLDPELEPSRASCPAGVEVSIGSWYERELVDLGFIPLTRTHGLPGVVVSSTPTIQTPIPAGSVNARMSSMLHYVLCLSRIAHCLKVMARDRVGGSTDAVGLERELNAWINRYVAPNDHVDEVIRARFPLRDARVTVKARPAEPGVFDCVLQVRPHTQLDDVTATMRLQSAPAPAAAVQRGEM